MLRRWLPIWTLTLIVLAFSLFPCDHQVTIAVHQGDVQAQQMKYSQALQSFGVASARCPVCPQPYLRQADILLTQRRFAAAQTASLSAARVGGLSAPLALMLARLYREQNAPNLSILYLQRVLTHRPARPDLWVALGEACLLDACPDTARQAGYEALGWGADPAQRQIIYDHLSLLSLPADPARALILAGQGVDGPDAARSDQMAGLILSLRQVVQDEQSATNWATLGEALFRRGELELARQGFEQALLRDPAYAQAHAYLGYTLSLLGQPQTAEQHLEQAIALYPDDPLVLYFLGMHHARRGRWLTARRLLEQAYDLDPTNPALCAAIADTYLRSNDLNYAAAERWLHTATLLAPDDVGFHLLLARFYINLRVDPTGRGLSSAQRAAELTPQDAEAHELSGQAYLLAARPDLALPHLLQAQTLSPDRVQIYYRLGQAWSALGQVAHAQEAYQQAVDLDWNGPIGALARNALAQ